MICTDVRVPLSCTESEILRAVCERLPIDPSEITDFRLLRKRLNCEERPVFSYDLTVGLTLDPERERGLLKMKKKVSDFPDDRLSIPIVKPLPYRPVVVGSGPGGLFAALLLAEAGVRPIVLERGSDVDTRRRAVERFHLTGKLDPNCNIQFGEGGAGTFSDGKLKAGRNDPYKMKVLGEFVAAGAPEDILYLAAPHLGTDKLPQIVKTLRKKLISLGADVIFNACLTDLSIRDGEIRSVIYETDGREEQIETSTVFLATGHSAHDVFRLLLRRGAHLLPRPFGIGVRIEHPRTLVNTWKYGNDYPPTLPTAEYHLVTHLDGGRSVYSFCMCPGGTVVAATSDDGHVVTNGMSEYARMGENSNAAFLVSVKPSDFPDASPLAGFALQHEIERAAFRAGGGTYCAPVQRLEDFMAHRPTRRIGDVRPTYPLGVTLCETDAYLPSVLTDALRAAVREFDAWMPGFYLPDALVTGAETRSTCPVRVLRDGISYEADGIRGLYPVGEGAGYSGGIVTSAMDGLRAAEAFLNRYLR